MRQAVGAFDHHSERAFVGEELATRGAGRLCGFGEGIAELAQLGWRQRLATRQSGADSGNEAIAVEDASLAEGGW